MDTSKQYIEMCEKAKEIQKGWTPRCGDFVGESKDYSSMAVSYTDLAKGYNLSLFKEGRLNIKLFRPNWLWLPRQDQLQEMMGLESKGYGLTWVFAEWLRDDDTRIYIAEQKFNTQEQLWLIFIMWEKWNKTWGGEKWIKKT